MIQTKRNLYYQIKRLRTKRNRLKQIIYDYEEDQKQFDDIKNHIIKAIVIQTCIGIGIGGLIYSKIKPC